MDNIASAIEAATGAATSELAPAKINLALHVGATRPDGYHDLESLVVFADLGDVITARPVPAGRATTLDLAGPFGDDLQATTPPGNNLALRAVDGLIAALPRRKAKPLQLTLTKRLPIAAGLGGGSADAAAALRLLMRIWGAELAPRKLEALAVSLGADVPMCLAGMPLVARGIGERITPVPGVPRLAVVLANPGVTVPTGAVFAGLGNETRAPLPPLPARFSRVLDLVFWLRETRNDLVDPARVVSRKANAAATALAADPDCLFARMTGSGASAFGIFINLAAAERAAQRLQAAKPNWWVAATTTRGS